MTQLTFGGTASKEFREISYQVTIKIEAGYNLPHTSETLIGYTLCCVQQFFRLIYLQ
jgi:hypothetical protein